MKTIAITRIDGGVSIMKFSRDDLDVALEIHTWKAVNAGLYASHREVPDSAVPTDRYFREALTPELTVNMEKARDIQKERLSEIQESLIKKADADLARAIENADAVEQARIVAKKQALRDVNYDPAIDAALTPEDLKAVIPDVLKEEKL